METEASRVSQFFCSLVLWESGRAGGNRSELLLGEGKLVESQRILVTKKQSLDGILWKYGSTSIKK